MRAIAQCGSIQGMEAVPERYQKIFLTAADLTPSEHIRMQATFQKHCDAAVSKTINFPVTATVDDIEQSFRLAWDLGCKGITVYRDQSRPHQVLSTGESRSSVLSIPEVTASDIQERPSRLVGSTEKIQTGFGNLYVTVNLHNGKPFEVFAHIGKSGFATMADTEAICRLISLLLRSGVSIDLVIRQLQGIGGGPTSYSEGRKITSIPDAIAQVLHSYSSQVKEESTLELEGNSAKISAGDFCPQCHQSLSREQRCLVCRHCGFSSC
jgi:ribonucleoside-diphosphate reductase alpha chain